MDTVLNVYQTYILPLLSKDAVLLVKKNKVSISVAVALLYLYRTYDRITKPPRNLRHIPQVDFWGFLGAFIKKEPIAYIAEKYTLPASLKSDHGMYVRFDNNGWAVHINKPDIVKAFLRSDNFPKASVVNDRKGTLFGKFAVGPNVAYTNGQKWKSQRMIANPAFHRSMPVKLFGSLTKTLFKVMDESIDQPINFPEMTARFALDAIGLAGFDFSFNAITEKDNLWVRRYTAIMKGSTNPLYLTFPVLDRKLLFLLPERRQLHKELDELLIMIQKIITDKRRRLKEKKTSNVIERERDLLTLMIEAENEGNGKMSDEELQSNLCIFFLAGHDTTANALACIAYYLATHRDVQQKAREEAIRVLGDEPVDIMPTLEQTRQLPYIDMVIKETLRINGPAANTVARTAKTDTELGGVFIPKGTRAVLEIFECHRNPQIWKSPSIFKPERFAPGGEAEQAAKLGMSFIPFSSGERQCIGMNFSLAEQRVLILMLLRKYEISLPKDSIHKEELTVSGLIILSPKNLYLNFKRLY